MSTGLLVAILIAAGLCFVLLELVIPSAGILSVLATVSLLAAVVLAFRESMAMGATVLVVIVIGVPVMFTLGIQLWSRTRIGRRFFLEAPSSAPSTPSEEREQRLRELVGKVGVAVTPLRPAGIVEVDGTRVDTVTEGIMVEPGTKVRIVRVDGITVVVRPVSKESL